MDVKDRTNPVSYVNRPMLGLLPVCSLRHWNPHHHIVPTAVERVGVNRESYIVNGLHYQKDFNVYTVFFPARLVIKQAN